MTDAKPPTLLIVMGTSGSGKSTVGSSLSTYLNCPFVDGDDLHPASNVAKMSSGQPLNDTDREPWLLRIRRTGLELALTQKIPDGIKGSDGEMRKLAEVYETSTQTKDAHHTTTQTGDAEEVQGSKSKIAVIACSSLKLVYRRLLRGSISSLADPKAAEPEADATTPTDLRVVHVYLDLSRELLEKRMAGRKGHFMKLDMLYSQLDTLQVPDEEAEVGVVRVKVEEDTTEDEVVSRVMEGLRRKGVI
ncbi:Shikimate kinase/Threonine synthase-like 1 [Kalmanozyma brasiliensis GHG001]|uniref:gluconokinase n=1 Tax=Kalmanozyma brasiliensis (strain GHG001) TaxID=1365824 RepID=V5GEY7_KALBG|nr:Shikimate kinase/Threonine synthase-like 1 [Kalmanozyma brasiliensis GHG001]EST04562.1 Shikimate kinase/Threonine synthase-like 1 [Kalmanozyma brasiliensis GHG001]